MKRYDYLVVGAGFFGAVFAREMTNRGFKCLVIDKNGHVGGHCYTEKVEGIVVHKYGPHIFHTNNFEVWKYVQRFATFRQYCHRIKANYQGKIYSFPINLMTLYQLWGVSTPEEARKCLEQKRIPCGSPQNLEEWSLAMVGREIYETFIQGYTKKQWNKDPKELPPFIIKRLPIRFSFNDTYYNDQYSGIPEEGYTALFENLLKGIEVVLNEDYFKKRKEYEGMADKIVYTGRIDEFFDYKYGELEYRTLRFETELLPIPDFQGAPCINYTDEKVPYTRINEYKHFMGVELPHTIISREYPDEWNRNKVPYYPVNTAANDEIYNKYKKEGEGLPHVIFGGRLAEFKYYDMHQVVASALKAVQHATAR